jgi:hypothetical protein
MQKFTIFTVILSVIIITIIAELVVQDYLQKVYSPLVQTNTLGTSNFDDFIAPFADKAEEDTGTQELADRIKELIPSTTNNSIEVVASKPFDEIIKLAPALQIPNLAFEQVTYENRLFQLIDTTSLNLSGAAAADINVGSAAIGSSYELKSRTPVDAEKNFDEIRILANSFPSIDTNQTNQFGDRSFYINHLVKVGEVFLVVQQDAVIYAFSYKKEYHETFKTFFGVLF